MALKKADIIFKHKISQYIKIIYIHSESGGVTLTVEVVAIIFASRK